MMQSTRSPSLQFDELLGRCMGNLELAAQAIDAFEAQFQDDLQELRQAQRNNDLSAARRTAHRMKGGAANVAATGLSEALSRLVDAAASNNPQEFAVKLEELSDLWSQFQAELE